MIDLISALSFLFSPYNIGLAAIGFIIGCLGGAIPGISGPLALTLIMPFTFGIPTEVAMLVLVGAYSGVTYASSVPAILINVPGSAGAAAAALDGYPMAKRGEGANAIAMAATASGVGSFFGALFLILVAPVMMKLVLLFGSMEYFLLAFLGLSTLVVTSGKRISKGLLAGVVGCLVGSVGASIISADARFTLGYSALYDGIPLVVVFIGVFAVAEMMALAGRNIKVSERPLFSGSSLRGFIQAFKYWKDMLIGSFIGIFTGIVPGEGATVANFLAYASSKATSKHPERFGTGTPEGLIAADASSNANISGSLLPTLAFGIPGSTTSAVLLAALLISGIRPGPNMFGEDINITYAIIGAVAIGGVMSLCLGVGLSRYLGAITRVPPHILIPLVLVVSLLGAFVVDYSYINMLMAVLFGVVGYFFIKYGFSVIAFTLGVILGPLAEVNLLRAYQVSGGDIIAYTVERPMSLVLISAILFILVWPLVSRFRQLKQLRDARP